MSEVGSESEKTDTGHAGPGGVMYSSLMTREEKEARIGRLTQEYSDTKNHVSILEEELRSWSAKLEHLGPLLRRANPEPILEALRDAPTLEKVKDRATELAAAKNLKDELKQKLRNCGIVID